MNAAYGWAFEQRWSAGLAGNAAEQVVFLHEAGPR